MLNFWFKLAHSSNTDQLSVIVYRFLSKLFDTGVYRSPFLDCVKTTIDGLGLSYYWEEQLSDAYYSPDCFKIEVMKNE